MNELGQGIAAFVVTTDALDEAALREHCRKSLAPYKVSQGIFTVDELPKTPLGKVVKADLESRLPKL